MLQEFIIKSIERVMVRAREEELGYDEIESLLYQEVDDEFNYEDSYNLE